MGFLTKNEATVAMISVAKELNQVGMLFRGNHANLSTRLAEDRFLMTQGGNVANLKETDFAVVSLQGDILEGNMDPVMREVVQMHAGIYRERSEVGAVIHTHAPHITAFAVANKAIPMAYEPLLRFGLAEEVPVVPWAPRGSEESVGGIIRTVKEHPGLTAVMMANHGVLVFNKDPKTTGQLLTTLDEAAELILMASAIGGAVDLPQAAFEQVKSRMVAFGSKRA